MTSPPATRIDGILAREANVAVLFRRGPSKWTQILRWDLDTDRVAIGQWIHGRVYTERCDLSPDGKLLVLTYSEHAPEGKDAKGESWTVVCRPPYLIPLAKWPAEGTKHGGGLWNGDRELALDVAPDVEIGDPIPDDPLAVVRLSDEIAWFDRHDHRMERGGWSKVTPLEVRPWNPAEPNADRTVQEGVMEKPFAAGRLIRTARSGEQTWTARDLRNRTVLSFTVPNQTAQWMEIDHRGRLVFGDTGRLWAWPDFPEGKPKFVSDLRENRYEEMNPPAWARKWPTEAAAS